MNIFERLALEKEEDYFKTGPGYEPPKYQSAIGNLYSDNARHFKDGANKAGAKKPIQYMNGAKAPYDFTEQNFPASIVTTTETVNLDDGSETHVVTKKDNDGNSEVVTKKLAPKKETSTKETHVMPNGDIMDGATHPEETETPKGMFEGFDAGSFFDNMALEKSDDYFKTGSGYEPPKNQSAMSNLYSDNARNFKDGPNKAGAEKPVQYMNGAQAPYEGKPDPQLEAAKIQIEKDRIAAREKMFPSTSNHLFNPDDPESYVDGKVPTFAPDVTVPVGDETKDNTEETETAATGIEVNDDGTVDENEINTKLDNKAEIKNDEKIINESPAAVKSIKQLEAELKTLNEDPARRKKVYLNFLRENGVLKEWRPQLFKALAGTAFRLLMGDGASDAFTYSFGRMQEKADAAQIAADEAELEKIKAGEDNEVEFGKDSKWVNLGTTKAPIKVKMTTRSDGVPVVSYKGKILTFDDLAKIDIVPRDYYPPDKVESHRNGVIEKLQGHIASLMTDNRFKDDEHIDTYVNSLLASTQMRGGLQSLEDDGVDVGPGMDSVWYEVLENAASDFIENKTSDNSAFPKKSYINFVNDRITKARINLAGINYTEFEPPEFQLEYDSATSSLIPNQDKKFVLEGDAWEGMKINAEDWFNNFAKENPNVKGLKNAVINRDYMGVAYVAYAKEKELNGNDWMISAQAGYKAGYLPFMYWLRENT